MSDVAVEKLTPQRRRQMTRDALVDAAAEVFVRRGFEGASLDEIAENAGFTRGAIYKNFDGKEELFLAVFDRVNERVLAAFDEMIEREPDAFSVAHTHELATMWSKFVGDSDLLTLEREFELYAIRNPSVRERSAAQHRRTVEMVARFIEEHAAAVGLRLRLPADTTAGILLSSSAGFARASQQDPAQTELYEAFLGLIIPVIFEPAEPPT